MIKHKYGKWIAFAIALIVLIFCIRSCEEHRNQKQVTKLKDEQAATKAEDKSLTELEANFRLKEAALRKEYQDSINILNAQYDSAKAQDVQIVTRWRTVPNKENCEAVIVSKDKIIKKAESRIKKQKQTISSDSVTILSLNRTIANKDATIAKNNNSLDKSITLAEKKSRIKRWGLGIQTGVSGRGLVKGQIQPDINIGISYNLIRW